jgi:hypothetical protein
MFSAAFDKSSTFSKPFISFFASCGLVAKRRLNEIVKDIKAPSL